MDYYDFLNKAYWLIENHYYSNICPFKLAEILQKQYQLDHDEESQQE